MHPRRSNWLSSGRRSRNITSLRQLFNSWPVAGIPLQARQIYPALHYSSSRTYSCQESRRNGSRRLLALFRATRRFASCAAPTLAQGVGKPSRTLASKNELLEGRDRSWAPRHTQGNVWNRGDTSWTRMKGKPVDPVLSRLGKNTKFQVSICIDARIVRYR